RPGGGGGVSSLGCDVLIEGEGSHPVPAKVALRRQGREHLELRRAGRDDDAGGAFGGDRLPDQSRSVIGRAPAHLWLGIGNVDLQRQLLISSGLRTGTDARRQPANPAAGT